MFAAQIACSAKRTSAVPMLKAPSAKNNRQGISGKTDMHFLDRFACDLQIISS